MSDEDKVLPATEGQEENQEEQTADVPQEDAAAILDSTTSTVGGQEKSSEFDWSQYKGTERFKGRGVQEVVDYLNWRERQYGEQSNELGQLREIAREHTRLKQQITGQKPAEKKPELSEVETAMFAEKFNQNPLSALNEHLVPKMVDTLADQVYQKVSEKIGPDMEGRAQDVANQYEYSQCVANHPEIETDQQLRWMMYQLTGNNYLGEGFPFEQVYLLSNLAIEEPSLFGVTCGLMRRGVTFKDAREFASLKQNAPANAEQTKEGIKKEIVGLRGGVRTPTKKQATNEPVVETMDEAFA